MIKQNLMALIDGSLYADSVCDYAAWAARNTQGSINLLHVLGRRTAITEHRDLSGSIGLGARSALLAELTEMDERRAKLELLKGRHLLDAATTRLTANGIMNVDAKLRHGDLIETVLEFEADASLIVIGKRGEAADFAKLHLGSNLERVVRAAHKPILVAPRAFKPVTRALIAFDGGASIMKAVQYMAQNLTLLFKDLSCTLLTVGNPNEDIKSKLTEAQSLLRSTGYNVDVSFEMGNAESVFQHKIETGEYNLLIMGAYGHSRIRNLIIGSTTTEMIRSCLAPIILFR